MIYIVMGVSSSGKTLIGSQLAKKMGIPFYDADDFHPEANVKKMSAGEPLNDRDRLPWLQAMARHMTEWEQAGGAVLACSALKAPYRKLLSPPGIPVRYIYLKGSKELIAGRMAGRDGHFMPKSLLDSQFEALEEPKAESTITVSIDRKPEEIVNQIINQLDLSS